MAALRSFVVVACRVRGTGRFAAGGGYRAATRSYPPPEHALIPAVKVSKATGWPAGATPAAAPGLKVNAFATGLDHPRWLYVLPNGDVLVAETTAPAPTRDRQGLKGMVLQEVPEEGRRRACPAPTASRLLRDADGDGVAEIRIDPAERPTLAVRHGARRQRTVRRQCRCAGRAFPYEPGQTAITAEPRHGAPLCRRAATTIGPRSLVASPDGR